MPHSEHTAVRTIHTSTANNLQPPQDSALNTKIPSYCFKFIINIKGVLHSTYKKCTS